MIMIYELDLPRSQYEVCDTCLSDIEVPTTPPPFMFSRQLLGYLFELRIDEADCPRLVDLKMCVMEQLAGADRNAEIIRRIHSMFPVERVSGFVTLSPMFLRLLRDRIVILLNACARRRQKRPLQFPRRRLIPLVLPPPRARPVAVKRNQQRPIQSWSLFNILSIFPMMMGMMRDWLNQVLEPSGEVEFFEINDSSDDEMSE